MLDKLLLFTLICRSVLYNGLKRRDVWLQVMAYLITKSHLGCGSFTLSAPFTSSQVRKQKKPHKTVLHYYNLFINKVNNYV